MDLNLKLRRERGGWGSWLRRENLQIKNKVVKTFFLDRLMKPHNVGVLQLPADSRLSLKFLEVWKEMIVEVRGGRAHSQVTQPALGGTLCVVEVVEVVVELSVETLR